MARSPGEDNCTASAGWPGRGSGVGPARARGRDPESQATSIRIKTLDKMSIESELHPVLESCG